MILEKTYAPLLAEPPRTTCRACGGGALETIVAFGETPLADGLVAPGRLKDADPVAPLTMVLCPQCSLVQILETVRPEVLFSDDYPYYSSVSPAFMEHARANAVEMIETRRLDAGSKAIEIASNDGYLLVNFVERGIPALGIDAAKGPAEAAQRKGVRTMHAFFTRELAFELRERGESADVLFANNVLAHVWDLNGFVDGIAALLKPDGVAVIECPYLLDLIGHCEFDTVYHQHLCYFSVTALDRLFRSHGLTLSDIRKIPIHGGSLRLYVTHGEAQSAAVTGMLSDEASAGVAKASFYEGFADRVAQIRTSLRDVLGRLKSEGKRVAGYGAAAKGTTMLAYCGVSKDDLEYIVDLNPRKHGLHMPGNRIPIVPVTVLTEDRPDYCLLLAWNFSAEILKQQQSYRDRGGRFIIPVPELRIV
ncbi:MAG: class I SAM-dependent methyltransferase [Bryobacteraceae bacterium]